MNRHGLLFCIIFCTTALTGRAQDKAAEWPIARGPSSEPAPFKYDRALLKAVPKAYFDDASACVLYNATSYVVQADGTQDIITHEVTRLGSRKGIDSLGEYQSITFNPNYQKLTLHEARIHKKDGTVVPIEPRHVQLRDVTTDYLVYDSDKQLIISFPSLEVGDVYEVKWTVRGKNPEFGSEFFARYTFGDERYPYVKDELHVVLPKEKPFKHAAINGTLEYRSEEKGGLRHHHWWAADKLPFAKEEDRPSVEELRLQLAMSTFASWDAVGKWKNKLRAECWKCDPAVRKVIEEVAGPHQTPLAKAQALTYWVRKQIRYVSRGPGGAGYTPHLPHHVLANRFGDCKDQAQLLAVMLKEIGLPVYLATIGAQDDGQVLPDVPSPWGTHAILLVKIDGKNHWIDTTASRAGWDYLPRGDRHRQAYVTENDQLYLMRTPAFTCDDNRFDQVSDVYIDSDGTAKIQRQTEYHGAAALSRRDAWVETPPGEMRRQVLLELQDAFTHARLSGLRVDDRKLSDYNQPVSATVDFQIARHFSGDETLEGSLTDSVPWSRLLAYNIDHERKLPLQLPGPFMSVHRYRIHLPPVFRFDSLPHKQHVESPWGHFKLDVKQAPENPRLLEMVMETRLEKDRVERDDFAKYQTFRDEVSKAYRVWLYFKPTRNIADAALLEMRLGPLSGGVDKLTAQTLARLYLDNNQLGHARRLLDRLLSDDVRDTALWDLRVRAVADVAEEEQAYRIMVDLFPRQRNYQLALGGVLVRRHNHVAARKVLEPLTVKGSARLRGQAHHQLAHSFFATKEYAVCLDHLQDAEAVDAASMNPAETQFFLATVYEKLGALDKALAAYRQAAKTDPESGTYLGESIRLQLTMPDAADALEPVRRFTLLAKDHVSLAEAADFHFQLGRYEDAYDLANRSRDLGFSSRAQYILGMIHFRRGECKEALFHLDRADESAAVNEALLRCCLALGQLTSAENRVDRLSKSNLAVEVLKNQIKELARRRNGLLEKLALTADRKASGLRAVDAYVCAEHVYRDGGQAVSLLNLALSYDGAVPGPAYALHGMVLLDQGKTALALADAEKAIALGPADSRAYLVRGRVRLLRAQATAALADLEQARSISAGKDAQVLHWLATAQFHAGQRNKALLTQRSAVELRPRDEEMLAQLREFEAELAKGTK